jgi:hypothetical protein
MTFLNTGNKTIDMGIRRSSVPTFGVTTDAYSIERIRIEGRIKAATSSLFFARNRN